MEGISDLYNSCARCRHKTIFITANIKVRALRRYKELKSQKNQNILSRGAKKYPKIAIKVTINRKISPLIEN